MRRTTGPSSGTPNSASRTQDISGVCLGFSDGHAEWFPSEEVLTKVADGEWTGVDQVEPNSKCGFAEQYPGVPTLY